MVDKSTDQRITDVLSHVMSVGDVGLGCAEGTPWHNEMVTSDRNWLTLHDIGERTGLPPGRLRRLIEDHVMPAVRLKGQFSVPEAFLDGDEPRNDIRGTFVLLLDAGFDNDEAVHWLLETEESLGVAPIDALAAGRKAEVRRVAQALA